MVMRIAQILPYTPRFTSFKGASAMKLAVPDLVTNSYFPAIAAVELGFFQREGFETSLEHVFPVPQTMAAMRDGELDFVAGGAHATLNAFPNWSGAKLLIALSQGMYWLLVLRSDLGVERGDVNAIKGLRIGAAPGVDVGLRRLLVEAGIDPERDGVQIAPVPGANQPGVSFGVTAARALEDGQIDGFWANAMGSETAVRRGVGTIVLDVRRGDGPDAARFYTFAALVTTDRFIERNPEAVAAAVRAIRHTQQALRGNPDLATDVGKRLFPRAEAGMIADIIRRDLPFYDPTISEDVVSRMNQFAQDIGLLSAPIAYDQVVYTGVRHLWTAS
jgi:ABC-type nitrate/sulfonate/bicarbonate transport system substrate-binding protein